MGRGRTKATMAPFQIAIAKKTPTLSAYLLVGLWKRESRKEMRMEGRSKKRRNGSPSCGSDGDGLWYFRSIPLDQQQEARVVAGETRRGRSRRSTNFDSLSPLSSTRIVVQEWIRISTRVSLRSSRASSLVFGRSRPPLLLPLTTNSLLAEHPPPPRPRMTSIKTTLASTRTAKGTCLPR
jgi:hypothetical protein